MSCLLKAKLEAIKRCRDALGYNAGERELDYCLKRILLDVYHDMCATKLG